MTYEEYILMNQGNTSSTPTTMANAISDPNLVANNPNLYGYNSEASNSSGFNYENGMQLAGLAVDGFNAWMAYKNYKEQKNNNEFNRKLGRANYQNQAKAFNMQVEDKARYRRAMRGDSSSEINSYLANNKEYRDRLASYTF